MRKLKYTSAYPRSLIRWKQSSLNQISLSQKYFGKSKENKMAEKVNETNKDTTHKQKQRNEKTHTQNNTAENLGFMLREPWGTRREPQRTFREPSENRGTGQGAREPSENLLHYNFLIENLREPQRTSENLQKTAGLARAQENPRRTFSTIISC